ncbi:hypothetical protein JVU11DRAFT_1609 [Chiua virens]|nr:hypothetical protein JVU11DRAFT_1609 [Chiua virens]
MACVLYNNHFFTVLTRLALTVPFSVWSKRRQWRAEEQVLPRLQSEGPVIAERILKDMQREKVRGTKEELHMIHSSRMKEAVAARRKELFAEHRCQPMITMVIPPLTQLPVFVGCSIALAHISQHPTPFDSESFLTLSTLVHPDPTAALPIALGFITLANVESSTWFMTDQQREREANVQKWKEQRITRGETVIQPQKIIKSALRLVSIGRILIATVVPGSVVLYWVTSATFGLVQTWILDYWELQRKKRLAATAITLTPLPVPSSLSPVSSGVVDKRRKNVHVDYRRLVKNNGYHCHDKARLIFTKQPTSNISHRNFSSGKVRLAKWFTTIAPKAKVKIVKDVTQLVLARRTRMCNFLEYKGECHSERPRNVSAIDRNGMECGCVRTRIPLYGPADTKVVYRRYASLFFVCGISSSDNELITLEIIHRYVEVLDRYFGNVSSFPSAPLPAADLLLMLYSIFNFQKAYAVCAVFRDTASSLRVP